MFLVVRFCETCAFV